MICERCRPVVLDMESQDPFDEHSPEMAVVERVWAESLSLEREAWHRVMCEGSELPADRRLVQRIADRIAEGVAQLGCRGDR